MSSFSIRIVLLETAMEAPVTGLDVTYSDFRSAQCSRVPVLRVFGSTPSGRKCCAHVRGVFPYFYVPYEAGGGFEQRRAYLSTFAASLDKAINIAVRRSSNSTVMHVFAVHIVCGKSFYGFHGNDSEFMKIYMFNPKMIKKAADLLLGGSVMNKVFQPYESHIPFGLQFLMDYNLYGMNFLHATVARRRLGGDFSDSDDDLDEAIGLDEEAGTPRRVEPSPSPRITHCRVEVDVSAADILNRLEVDDNLGSNPGLTALWEEEIERRRELLGETPPVGSAEARHAWVAPPDSPDREGVEATNSEAKWRRRFRRFLQERGLINATGVGDDLEAGPAGADEEISKIAKEAEIPEKDAAESAEADVSRASVTEEDVDDFLNRSSSPDTVLVASDNDDSAAGGEAFDEALNSSSQQPAALVNRASIDRVVSFSQSFVASSDSDEEGQSSTSDEDEDADGGASDATCEERASKMLDEFLIRSPLIGLSQSGRATELEESDDAALNESQRDLFATDDEFEDEPAEDEQKVPGASNVGLDRAALLQYKLMEEQDSVLAVPLSDDDDEEEADGDEEEQIGDCPQFDGANSSSSESDADQLEDDRRDEDELEDLDEDCFIVGGTKRRKTQPSLPQPPARRGRRLGLSFASRSTRSSSSATAAATVAAESAESKARSPVPSELTPTSTSTKAFKPVAQGSSRRLSGRPVLLGKRRSAYPTSPSPQPRPPLALSTEHLPSPISGSTLSETLALASPSNRPLTSTQQMPDCMYPSPTSANQPPISANQLPISTNQPPTLANQLLTSAIQPPTSANQPPISTNQPPTSANQLPISTNQPPTSANQPPTSTKQSLSSANQLPTPTNQPATSANQLQASIDQSPKSADLEPSTVPKKSRPHQLSPQPGFVFAPSVAPPSATEVADSLLTFDLFPHRNPHLRQDADGIADLAEFDSLAVGPAGLPSFNRAAALAAASATAGAALFRYRPLVDPPSRRIVEQSLVKTSVPNATILPTISEATRTEDTIETQPSVATSDETVEAARSTARHSRRKSIDDTASSIGRGVDEKTRSRKRLLANVKAKVRRSLSETSSLSASSNAATPTVANSVSSISAAAAGGDSLTLAAMELLTRTRPGLLPDPRHDAIVAIFLTVADSADSDLRAWERHCLFVAETEAAALSTIRCLASCDSIRFQPAKDEAALFECLASIVRCSDPDIVLGFDTQRASWGYLIDRAKCIAKAATAAAKAAVAPDLTGLLVDQLLSRYKQSPLQQQQQQRRRREIEMNISSQSQRPGGGDQSQEGLAGSYEAQSDSLRIGGRIVINLWRLLRYELSKLRSHSFEACAALVLNRRHPCYPPDRLWRMWQDGRSSWRALDHLETRSSGCLQLLSKLGLVSRTSEFARVFGIEFYHVLSRGSQYRVESMMLRLAKPLGLLPLSPSVQQRARQAAPDAIPLTLEPRSGLHTDPVVVLDFQSLYPSIMIAYNYCFSTCIGRAANITTCDPVAFEFGCHRLMTDPGAYQRHANNLNFSPLGIGFVSSEVRQGVISRMVEEILATRLMVKAAMKRYRGNEALQKLLDARQLGLKLIANVTYGYTAASFSGRMPCVEVGDSIVRKARETLERAIALVQSNPDWRAQVIYGDTDSLFVLLPGRSRAEAFQLGQAMARAVTAENPKPVKLRFEKVYQPCLLLTKKHYAGFMYETADQTEPVFDAKGIETVRRDSCPAAGRILGRCLQELFRSLDLSRVRRLVEYELHRLHWGRSPLQELIIAREYRGTKNYSDRAAVPALAVVRRLLAADPRAEPPIGYRVQFVIVRPAEPGQTLCSCARSPDELLIGCQPGLASGPECLNLDYYASKQILPPLDRALTLLGVNVFAWHAGLAKPGTLARVGATGVIGRFLGLASCRACGGPSGGSAAAPGANLLCQTCSRAGWAAIAGLFSAASSLERRAARLADTCAACQSGCVAARAAPLEASADAACRSTDCPVAFERWALGGPATLRRLEEIRRLADGLA